MPRANSPAKRSPNTQNTAAAAAAVNANANASCPNASASASPPATASRRVMAVDINPQFVVVRNFSDLEATVRAVRSGPLPPRCHIYDKLLREAGDVAAMAAAAAEDQEDDTLLRQASDAAAASILKSNGEDSDSPSRDGPASPTEAQPRPPPQGPSAAAPADNSAVNGSCANDVRRSTHLLARCASGDSLASLTSSAGPGPPGVLGPNGAHSRTGTAPEFPRYDPGAAATASPTARLPGAFPQQQQQPRPSSSSSLARGGGSSDMGSPLSTGTGPARNRSILCVWDVDDTLVASGAAGTRQNYVFGSTELSALFRSLPGARHLLLSQGSIDDVFYPGSGRLRFLEKYFGSDKIEPAGGGDAKRKKSGGFFCGGTKERKPHAPDLTMFEKGTALIRLSVVGSTPEAHSETDFLYKADVRPTLRGATTKDQIRWLVLRPSTRGITLATLNSLFAPSQRTACVDGKVFHKMDVVWSLAKSGLWDAVFFIDNNLSEVGVARYGKNMSNVLDMHNSHSMFRFFKAEFLLLAASAKLRQLEISLGRDVTKPPPQQQQQGDATEEAGGGGGGGGSSAPQRVRPINSSLTIASGSNAGPSGSSGGSAPINSSPNRPNGGTAAASSPSRSAAAGGFAPGPRGGRCRGVDLVVAHFHMGVEAYKAVLAGNRSGTVMGTGNTVVTRSVGQPTFMGDFTLTDNQYEAVLGFFRMEESALYQLIDEDVRLNGYVAIGTRDRWMPSLAHVHTPVFRRPVTVPHMRRYYATLCRDVEERVVQPVLKGAGLVSGATVIRGDAHMLCTQLLRAGPFIDSFAQGTLALELFLVYTAEGHVPKAMGDYVRKAIAGLAEEGAADGAKKKKSSRP